MQSSGLCFFSEHRPCPSRCCPFPLILFFFISSPLHYFSRYVDFFLNLLLPSAECQIILSKVWTYICSYLCIISIVINPLRSTYVLSHFSHVWLFVTTWTAAYQAPLSLGLSRQEHWGALPFPSPVKNILLSYNN